MPLCKKTSLKIEINTQFVSPPFTFKTAIWYNIYLLNFERTLEMQTKRKPRKTATTKGRKLPWRKNPKVWTDTLYDKKLLNNPSLMTSHELANALAEHIRWRTSQEKYDWNEDPFKEGKEEQAPFSAHIVTGFLYEAIARLAIIADTNCGRFKADVKI